MKHLCVKVLWLRNTELKGAFVPLKNVYFRTFFFPLSLVVVVVVVVVVVIDVEKFVT